MSEGLERVLGVAGVAFAAALGLAALVDDERTVAYALGLATFFLVAFLGALRGALRAAEGETAPLSATAVIAGSVAAAGYGILAAAYAALARAETGERAVDVAEFAFFVSFPQAAVLATAGTVMLRTGVVSRELGLSAQALVPLELGAPLILVSSEANEWGTALVIAPFAAWVAAAGALLVRAERP